MNNKHRFGPLILATILSACGGGGGGGDPSPTQDTTLPDSSLVGGGNNSGESPPGSGTGDSGSGSQPGGGNGLKLEKTTLIQSETDAYINPHLFVRDDGQATAIWSTTNGETSRIEQMTFVPGAGWSGVDVVASEGSSLIAAGNKRGDVMAVWLAGTDYFWSFRSNGQWTSPQMLPDGVEAYQAKLKMDEGGRSILVRDGSFVEAAMYDPAAGWSSSVPMPGISSPGATVDSSEFAFDIHGSGTAAVAWFDYANADGSQESLYVSRFVNNTWESVDVILTEPTVDRRDVVGIEMVGENDIVVAWDDEITSEPVFRTMRYRNGQWEPATTIDLGDTTLLGGTLDSSGAGVAFLTATHTQLDNPALRKTSVFTLDQNGWDAGSSVLNDSGIMMPDTFVSTTGQASILVSGPFKGSTSTKTYLATYRDGVWSAAEELGVQIPIPASPWAMGMSSDGVTRYLSESDSRDFDDVLAVSIN